MPKMLWNCDILETWMYENGGGEVSGDMLVWDFYHRSFWAVEHYVAAPKCFITRDYVDFYKNLRW